MVQPTGQSVPNSPSQQTSGGGFWAGLNNTLTNAFGMYLSYEQVRQQANGNGQSMAQKPFVTELPNGSQLYVDDNRGMAVPVVKDTFTIAGNEVPKMAVYAVAGLAALVVLNKFLKG